jgi:hypothetical protein
MGHDVNRARRARVDCAVRRRMAGDHGISSRTALAWLCSVHDEHVDLDGLLHVREVGLRGMYR